MDVVTIMDYPDDEKYNLLCMIWLRRMRLHAPDARLHLFTLRGLPPAVQRYAASFPEVSVEPALFRPLAGYDHFNLAVKLPTLSRLEYPFVFFDADIFLISDLAPLWALRNDQPWIGVNDQLSELPQSRISPHLNSGMQLVGDPSFYDYDAIVDCFEAHGRQFVCHGEDQSLLTDYFRSKGYDYRHPRVDAGWNCCSRYARLTRTGEDAWRGETRDYPAQYPVHAVHYWNGACRPWHLKCPLFEEESRRLRDEGWLERSEAPAPVEPAARRSLRVHVVNAPASMLSEPGEHPFAPLGEEFVEPASRDEADVIFWALRPERLMEDYHELVYQHHALFRAEEERFIFYSTARSPSVFYLNNALSLTPFPLYDAATNALSRVVAVPWLGDGGRWPCLDDEAFLLECRAQPKQAALAVAGPLDPGLQQVLASAGVGAVLHVPVTPVGMAALPEAQRDRLQREVMKYMASAHWFLHRPEEMTAPLWIYQALLAGTPPILRPGLDLPFSAQWDWHKGSLLLQPGRSLAEQYRAQLPVYAGFREGALKFADSFLRPRRLQDRMLQHLIRPHLARRKAAGPAASSTSP